MSSPIVVLGSANADYSMRTPHIPKPGETLTGHDFRFALGGKGANQAMAASKLNGRVAFVACVGNDAAGTLARQVYADAGIDTQHVHVCPAPTGSALIFVADSGENSIGVAAGANAQLSVERVDAARAVIAHADYLLMQLETPLATILHAAQLARDNSTAVILNPAPAQPLPDALLASTDMLTPNETELATLTGLPTHSTEAVTRAAKALIDRGTSRVVVTRGSIGAQLVTREISHLVAAPQVTTIDTTAAGDTFNGALVVALAEGHEIEDAIAFANQAAAISVTRRGALDSVPDRDEVDAFR